MMSKLWDQSGYGEVCNECGLFQGPLTGGWKLPEIVLAAESNPISMMGI